MWGGRLKVFTLFPSLHYPKVMYGGGGVSNGFTMFELGELPLGNISILMIQEWNIYVLGTPSKKKKLPR